VKLPDLVAKATGRQRRLYHLREVPLVHCAGRFALAAANGKLVVGEFIEPALPSPAEQSRLGPRNQARRPPGLSPEMEKRPTTLAGRSFILRPFPLMGTTKTPARNDRTHAVPPKCAASFLGYAK
jgi:hypothetical protein